MTPASKVARQTAAIKATTEQLELLTKAKASAQLLASVRTKLARQTAALKITEELAAIEARRTK